MSGRKIDTRKIGNMTVRTEELDFTAATDLMPEIADALAPGIGAIRTSVAKARKAAAPSPDATEAVGEEFLKAANGEKQEAISNEELGNALGGIASRLMGGRLTAILPRLLAGTMVTFPDEEGRMTKIEALDTLHRINQAFTGRKMQGLAVIKVALEVNFRDFFVGAALLGV